jgi:hypothetical protein
MSSNRPRKRKPAASTNEQNWVEILKQLDSRLKLLGLIALIVLAGFSAALAKLPQEQIVWAVLAFAVLLSAIIIGVFTTKRELGSEGRAPLPLNWESNRTELFERLLPDRRKEVEPMLRQMQSQPDDVIDNLVYVAMSMESEDEVLRYAAIVNECRSKQFVAVHLREIADFNRNQQDTVHALIDQANLVVFDISDESPDIVYQLGFQRGLAADLPEEAVLLLAKLGRKVMLTFRPFNVRRWSNTAELQSIMSERLLQLTQKEARAD